MSTENNIAHLPTARHSEAHNELNELVEACDDILGQSVALRQRIESQLAKCQQVPSMRSQLLNARGRPPNTSPSASIYRGQHEPVGAVE
jgi:hypothetical protein